MKEKLNVYEIVTKNIIEMMDAGTIPWKRPWKNTSGPMNLISKKPYRGINYFILSFSQYTSPYWLTFKQATQLGGKIKKGEQSTLITFSKVLQYQDKVDAEKMNKYFFLRYYRVFNLEQCEGIEAPKVEERPAFNRIEEAERLIREMPLRPRISYGGDRACYSPLYDSVKCPERENFEPQEEFYCTMFHELAHATGHESRLKRFDKNCGSIFGSESYSKEELVAEMTAAFLCASVGIEQKIIGNAAAYIAGWKKQISSDPKFIVQAANAAQRAADYILNKKAEEKKVEAKEDEEAE